MPALRKLRVAAIDFLNPAPLMWDFEHPPLSTALADRYDLRYSRPAECAARLAGRHADLGLIPVAALTPELAIVPGCTIASLTRVRSIQLILKAPHTLTTARTVAADSASRSSLAYAQVLFRHFHGNHPAFVSTPADPIPMLQQADAALLIGDPALLALERRTAIEAVVGRCTWLDLAEQWHLLTGLPWVAAVWAVHPSALPETATDTADLIRDLIQSRDAGLAHIPSLVGEWTPRIALPPATIEQYLTRNIHYILDPACLEAITLFRTLASSVGVLPALGNLRLLA